MMWYKYNTMLSIISLIAIFSLGYWCFRLRASKFALQQKLSVVQSGVNKCEARLEQVEKNQREELSQEQIDYRDKLQTQYSVLYQQIRDGVKDELKSLRSDATDLAKKKFADFDALVKAEFEKACAEIKFNEIEYKRTITKKRREYSRKNGKNAKPQRVWRYIDEE